MSDLPPAPITLHNKLSKTQKSKSGARALLRSKKGKLALLEFPLTCGKQPYPDLGFSAGDFMVEMGDSQGWVSQTTIHNTQVSAGQPFPQNSPPRQGKHRLTFTSISQGQERRFAFLQVVPAS